MKSVSLKRKKISFDKTNKALLRFIKQKENVDDDERAALSEDVFLQLKRLIPAIEEARASALSASSDA
jgi:hypothetical protein